MSRPLDDGVRTRIAPAPSGDLHVGNVRTALFSWALARRYSGRFVLRIEDTDASRVDDASVAAAVEILDWAGLDWDEGPGIGGPYAPYRQSERGEIYTAAVDQLLADRSAYHCYCTPEEIAARKAAAGEKTPGYDGFCRTLPAELAIRYAAEKRPSIVRFAVPAGSTTWTDLVKGEITIAHDQIPDFALTRSGGAPLYVLAAAVDDMAMRMTHIVRGEDLVAATPRQRMLYAALGHPAEEWPDFGHLPLIVGEDGKPLSKRNGEVSLRWYRDHGFLPAAVLNYLALLGWSLTADREHFDIHEMVAHFDLGKVSRNPARFDIRKLEALNGEWIRGLSDTELSVAVRPYLAQAGYSDDIGLLQACLPLVRTRMSRLTDVVSLLGFLFMGDEQFVVMDPDLLGAEARPALEAARAALDHIGGWSAGMVERALRQALETDLGLKPRAAYTPVRVAVTGHRVSPPLWESLELLGRERTLARLEAGITMAAG